MDKYFWSYGWLNLEDHIQIAHTANIALIKSSSNWGYGKLFGPAERKNILILRQPSL